MEGVSKTATPQLKRRKTDPPSTGVISSSAAKGGRDGTLMSLSPAAPQIMDGRIQQLRNQAVAQAQQDSCTGNFRIFDSAFGNFLLPVIPTQAELTRS